MSDPFDLDRFVAAQRDVYDRALAELQAGRKRSHWMWFVFPQIAGLGSSEMAQRYAIGSPDEARAYLAHPLLGPRLIACAEAVKRHAHLSAHDIFGSPDDLKFRSSLTLFTKAEPTIGVFRSNMDHFFDGLIDERTIELMERRSAS